MDWRIDLNIKFETIKFPEESVGGKLLDSGLDNYDFFWLLFSDSVVYDSLWPHGL